MTDIPVTVSAPGATKAAAELRGVATATERAGQAAAVNAAQQAKQSQALTRSAQAAKAATAEAKKARAEMQMAATRGAAAGGLGRFGGIVGSGIAAGGMSDGASRLMAGMAVGAAVLTTAVAVIGKVVERSAALMLKEAEGRARRIKMEEEGAAQVRKAGLSWAEQNGSAARGIVALGGEGALSVANRLSKEGIVGADKGILAALEGGRYNAETIAAGQVASRTGMVTFEEAIKLAVSEGVSGAADILSAKANRSITNDEMEQMLQRVGKSSLVRSINTVDEIRGQTGVRLQKEFSISGEAQARMDMAATFDPAAAKILAEFNDKMLGLEEMRKAGESQGIMARIWQNMTNADGSINVRVMRQANDLAAGEGIPVN